MLAGEYEWAINDQPAKVLTAGETFYESAGCLHRVSKNPARQGQDPGKSLGAAPAGRHAARHPGAEEMTTVPHVVPGVVELCCSSRRHAIDQTAKEPCKATAGQSRTPVIPNPDAAYSNSPAAPTS